MPLLLAVLWCAPDARAALVAAQSGFNDATGISSDATPDSPFTLGQTVAGRGVGEPGWAGPWGISRGGGAGGAEAGTAQSFAAYEGDGGLFLEGRPNAGEMWANRFLATPFTGKVIISQNVQLKSLGLLQSRPGNGGVGTLVGAHWQFHADGHVFAGDGQLNGNVVFEDTGFTYTPNTWYKVSTIIDVPSQTYRFFFNDVEYLAPDPLNFRGDIHSIDFVDYLAQTDVYVDNVSVVPEPTAALAGSALSLLLLRRRRVAG
jgi:hypothetical protein